MALYCPCLMKHYLFVFQPMVHVRDSPGCAICEYVMKQLESMLEDHETEVGQCPNMVIKISNP